MTSVNLYEFFPYTWIVHFARYFVVFNITHAIVKDKYNSFVTFISITASGLLYSYITLQLFDNNSTYTREYEILTMIGCYLLMFIVVSLTAKGNFFSIIFSVLFSLVAYLCGTYFYLVIKGLFGDFSISTGLNTVVPLRDVLFTSLFAFVFSFIFVFIIKLILMKTKHSFLYNSKLLFLFLFPVTHIFSTLFVFSQYIVTGDVMQQDYIVNEKTDVLLILFSLLCMIIDVSIIFVIDYIEKVENKNIQNEKDLLKNQMDYYQMKMLKEEQEKFRKIKHDFANIITTAKGFIEIDKTEKALTILSNTNEDLLGIAGFSVCLNETINTVLYIKQQQAEKSNIRLDIDIEESCSVLIDDYDLCRLLHNILDNALNACLPLSDNRYCKIFIEINSEKLLIKTENKYITSKTKHNNKKSNEHGNGTGIIKNIASKYGGTCVYNQLDDVWYTTTFLDNKKSANSTPPRTCKH